MATIKEEGSRLLESAFSFTEIKMRLVTLKTADKSARLATGFLTIVIIALVFIFSMVMLSIAVALLLSRALESASAGFFIVAAFYVVAGIVLVTMRKKIIYEPLLNSIVKQLLGSELQAERRLEKVQDKIEDKLNLEKQPD